MLLESNDLFEDCARRQCFRRPWLQTDHLRAAIKSLPLLAVQEVLQRGLQVLLVREFQPEPASLFRTSPSGIAAEVQAQEPALGRSRRCLPQASEIEQGYQTHGFTMPV